MKELSIKKCGNAATVSREEIARLTEAAAWNEIDTVNWPEYPYRPSVRFRMAYNDSAFLLHYRVEEKHIRAAATVDNGEVWKDSCVEFFVLPGDDGIYYNFEFNCTGRCLLSAGLSRAGRESAPLAVIAQISRFSGITIDAPSTDAGNAKWEMLLAIPYTCFFKHPGFLPAGKTVRANFYKCGDDLPEPHFLSWNPVEAKQPDFHRPECFGRVKFE